MRSSSLVALCSFATLVACGAGNAAEPQSPSPLPSNSSASGASSQTTPSTPVPPAAASPALSPDAIRALVAAGDRTDEDKKLDAHRHPEQFLAFIGVAPGMRVADLGAGGGYTTELLSRAVGPSGKVYAQNDPGLVKRFLDKPMTLRLARPVNAGVVRVDRSFDDPLPAEAKDLDLVVIYIFYHDVVWIGADRDKMNKAILAALKPGGAYVIVDASAKNGDGISVVKTLHRIEESTLKTEVLRAGFTFSQSGDFLRNAGDTRDWNSSPGAAGEKRGTEDRFVLKFVKP